MHAQLPRQRPPRIQGQSEGGAGAESIVTSDLKGADGFNVRDWSCEICVERRRLQSPYPNPTHQQQQDAAGTGQPLSAPPPSPAAATPVRPANATSSGTPTAAARLNLTGNAKAPSTTETLLNVASGAAAASEKIKEALEHDPSLVDVLDDTKFFQGKQILPGQECWPMNAEELEVAIEVRNLIDRWIQ